MSHTNSTSNYHLPQFVGSDKPAWLVDFNSAMSDIDTAIKNASDSATTAGGKATANETAIGTLSSLTTTDKTDLVSAVNEVNASAGTATSSATTATATANSALNSATSAVGAVSALKDYLDLSVHNTYNGSQFTVTAGTGTPVSSTEIYVARNSDGTLGKVYGALQMNSGTAGTTTVKLNLNTGLQPEERMTIVGAGFCTSVDGTIANGNLIINTDGTIELSGYHTAGTFYFRMVACLLFIQNFGDTPAGENI